MYFFEKIGIRIGHKVLDFGCGKGNYTIPLAKVIGSGIVYAVDINEHALEILAKRIYTQKLTNVRVIHSTERLKIPLCNSIVDVVFYYDLLHDYYFEKNERSVLLEEASRVLKPGGLLSIYPKHMNAQLVKEDVVKQGFLWEQDLEVKLIHDDKPIEDTIMNFRKK